MLYGVRPCGSGSASTSKVLERASSELVQLGFAIFHAVAGPLATELDMSYMSWATEGPLSAAIWQASISENPIAGIGSGLQALTFAFLS